MSGVQNDLRRFPSEKLLHIFGFQPSGADMEKFIFLQKGAAIFRSCTGINRNMIFRKELTERIAPRWSLQKQWLYTFLYPLWCYHLAVYILSL